MSSRRYTMRCLRTPLCSASAGRPAFSLSHRTEFGHSQMHDQFWIQKEIRSIIIEG